MATIAGVVLTKDNYKGAVDLLHERYGNKQVIISSDMESLLKLPRVNFVSDIKRVRMVYDQIEIKICSLPALGIKAESYGSLLILVVMEKITQEFWLVISCKMKSDTWDVNELIKAFKEELEEREKTRLVGGSGNVVEKPWLKPKIPRDPITPAALFLPERGQANCYFCNHPGHRLFNCTSVTDPEKRKEILKKKGRCFVCVKKRSRFKLLPVGIQMQEIVWKTSY